MTTDKERAETWRRIADCYESLGEYPVSAADAREVADQLDPPKPQWPDGTVAWVTNSHQRTYLCQWCDTEDNWCIGGPDGDSAPGSVTKVEPLRVLGDEEIAIERTSEINLGMIDALIDGMSHCGDISHRITRDVLGVIRDALDAEAGEQS